MSNRRHKYALYYQMGQHFCAGCGQWFDFEGMTVDHITPKSLGGKNNYFNLQLMCSPCNHKKGNRCELATR